MKSRRTQVSLLVVLTVAVLGLLLLRGSDIPGTVKSEPTSSSTHPTSAPQPTQSSTPSEAHPAHQSPTLDAAQFARLTESVQADLPHTDDIRRLTAEQAHGIPPQLREAGQRLGQVSQALHANPMFAVEGLKFYRQCAQRAELPESLRALCYANLRNLSQAAGKAEFFQEGDYPAAVRRLGDHIPPGW